MSKEKQKDEVLTFCLDLEEKPVRITKKNGEATDYILRELDGLTRDKHLNFMAERSETDENGNIKLTSFDNLHAKLISLHLIDIKTGQNEQISEIAQWPSKVISALHKECQKISGLDEDKEKGNDQKAKESTG